MSVSSQPSGRSMVTAKFSPTRPLLSRIASSCRSVRLRATGVRAWALEWLATSGWSESWATSQKPFSVMMGKIDQDAEPVAGLDQLACRRRSGPGPVSGLDRKGEGHAVAEDVVAAPDRAERAQSGGVEYLERRRDPRRSPRSLPCAAPRRTCPRPWPRRCRPCCGRASSRRRARFCSAMAAMSSAMSSEGWRSSGRQRRRVVAVGVGLVDLEIAGRDVDRAEPAGQPAGPGAGHVDMASLAALRACRVRPVHEFGDRVDALGGMFPQPVEHIVVAVEDWLHRALRSMQASLAAD